MDGCIVYTGIRFLLHIRPLFLSFSFSQFANFQTLNTFVAISSGTVRLRKLKHGTHMDNGWMYGAYQNQAIAAAKSSSPFISSFFFLSNFQTSKCFVALFSGTVRPTKLKLGTDIDSGCVYCVYRNHAPILYLSLYFVVFRSLQFPNFKFSSFSWIIRPMKL